MCAWFAPVWSKRLLRIGLRDSHLEASALCAGALPESMAHSCQDVHRLASDPVRYRPHCACRTPSGGTTAYMTPFAGFAALTQRSQTGELPDHVHPGRHRSRRSLEAMVPSNQVLHQVGRLE